MLLLPRPAAVFVADSDAENEWQETLVKAKALLAGIRTVEGK